MSSISDLRPGDIGFGPIHGAAGALVNVGQLMLGEGFHIGRLDVRHVFVVTSPEDPTVGDYRQPRAVEAMPGGAVEVGIGDRWTPEYAYVRLPEDYPGQAADAAAIARAMIGTPYSFASYVALAAWRFGRKPPAAAGPGMKRLEAWIDRRKAPRHFVDAPSGTGTLRTIARPSMNEVALPAEAICSVLADQAWALTGKQVMPAGTPHQCVTPGALARALLETPGAQWSWPQ